MSTHGRQSGGLAQTELPESPYARAEGVERQARMLAAGEARSVELTEHALRAIELTQPALNTFRTVCREAALSAAEEADRRLAAGERSPLLGVPIAVKDDIDLAGEATPNGCLGDFPRAHSDCEMAARLRAAGAVIVGKTTTPELSMYPVQQSTAFGVTRNPWDRSRTPGGSSGGLAAAVAAGLVSGGIGSDGGGSVRIPAAWTHLVGIKPQLGRVSPYPDREQFHGLTVMGPIARTVRDAALLLDAVSGAHPADIHRAAGPRTTFRDAADRDPGRLRIAVSARPAFSWFGSSLSPLIRLQLERVARVLAGSGHEIFHEEPRYGLAGAAFMPKAMAGFRDWGERIPDHSLLDRRSRESIAVGRLLGGAALRAARASEPRIRRRVGRIFERADVVLAPTTAQPPLAAGALEGLNGFRTDRMVVGACPFTWPWNVLGWPGINIPAGFTPDGLPIGLQLLGPESSEELLISLAAQLEAVERWDVHWPPVHS
jgi:amidase